MFFASSLVWADLPILIKLVRHPTNQANLACILYIVNNTKNNCFFIVNRWKSYLFIICLYSVTPYIAKL